MRLLFPLSYTSGAGAAIRSPQQADIRLAGEPRFERRSRTYEAGALPTELHQRKILEVAGRIALPMICFAGRCLAVLATPPRKLGAEGGTRTRALYVGNVASLPLDDFRMERAARVELASSAWKAEAPAAIPCSQWREMKDSNLRTWIWRPVS